MGVHVVSAAQGPRDHKPEFDCPLPSEQASDPLVAEVLENMRQVFKVLRERQGNVWASLDLTMAQMKTLVVVARHPNLPVGQVAEALDIGLPTASHLVERLVRAGLLERVHDPDDRRVALCHLTAEGQGFYERMTSLGPATLARWLGRLDEPALRALRDGMRALLFASRHDQEDDPKGGS